MAENTFTSFPAVVGGLTLLGPFSFLCTQRWDPVSKVPLIPAYTPIFLLSGARDEVVPMTHMEALWEVAKSRHEGGAKDLHGHDRFELFPTGFHCGFCCLLFLEDDRRECV
jgi:fermentation-respiration switch protein FrsA (DUF1100 family)